MTVFFHKHYRNQLARKIRMAERETVASLQKRRREEHDRRMTELARAKEAGA